MKPHVYFRKDDKTRGTIVAIAPCELFGDNIPDDTEKFVISRAELEMFQRELVPIAHWCVMTDPKTHVSRLMKNEEAVRYESDNMLVEVRDLPDPEVQITYREGHFIVTPGPRWEPTDRNVMLDFYLIRRGDPNVLYCSERIAGVDLTHPHEIFCDLMDRPLWDQFTILTNGGFQYGLRRET